MVIVWSDLAEELLKSVLVYMTKQFGELIAMQTLEKVNAKIKQLERYPEIGIPDFKLSSQYNDEAILVRHLNLRPNIISKMAIDRKSYLRCESKGGHLS